MKKLLYIVLVLFYVLSFLTESPSFAQIAKLDSLEAILKNTLDKETKVELLHKLAHASLELDPNKSRTYSIEAIDLAQNINFVQGIAKGYDLLGLSYLYENNPEKALDNFKKAIVHYGKVDEPENLAVIYNEIGLIFKNKGEYKQALENFQRALLIYNTTENKMGASSALQNIGVVYRYQANYEKAIEHYIKALKIKEEINDKWGIAILLGNLGILYKDQKNYDQALSYYSKVKDIFEELDNKRFVGITLNNIGQIYEEKNEGDQALNYYQQSLLIFESLGMKSAMGTSLGNIGSIYYDKEEYEAALESQIKALEIFQELEQKSSISSTNIEIGSIYTKINEYENAYSYLINGLNVASEIGDRDNILKGYKVMFEYYEATGNYTRSLDFYKRFSALKDSIFNIKKSEQIAEIQTRYETEKKEQENELLRKERAIIDQTISEKSYQNKLLLVAILFFLIFTGYFYYVFRQKKHTNQLLSRQNDEINQKQEEIIKINKNLTTSQQQLSQAYTELQKLNTGLESTVKERTSKLLQINDELDTFLYQSSHALRRPIVSIMGLVNVARMETKGKDTTVIYDKIIGTATKMDLMLKKLVMASEINSSVNGRQEIDFENIIIETWGEVSTRLAEKKVNLNFSICPEAYYFADRILVKIIFQNLLENALLHHLNDSPDTAFVNVAIKQEDNTLHLCVEDNGSGISKEGIHKIFEMFTVANHTPKGFGLGLYIVKKAVEKLNGTIAVDSKENEYSKFHIILPL